MLSRHNLVAAVLESCIFYVNLFYVLELYNLLQCISVCDSVCAIEKEVMRSNPNTVVTHSNDNQILHISSLQ